MQNVFETLYISKDPQAQIIIEDLTQQLKLSEQKNEFYSSENKRLSGKLQQYSQKYKSSQVKKKQINSIQNELQDIYKGNLSTLEVLLQETQRENNELVDKYTESKAYQKQQAAKILELGDTVNMQQSKIAAFMSEVAVLNQEITHKLQHIQDLELKVKELISLGLLKDAQIEKVEKDLADSDTQNENLENQNEELKEKISQLQTQLDAMHLENKQLKELLSDKDQKFLSKSSTLDDLSNEFNLFRNNKAEEIKQLQTKIYQLDENVKDLTKKYEDSENRVGDLEDTLEAKDKELEELAGQIKLLKEQNNRLFGQNSKLTMKVTELEGQLDAYDRQSEKSFTSGSSASSSAEQLQSLEFLLEQERSRVKQIRDSHLSALKRITENGDNLDTEEETD